MDIGRCYVKKWTSVPALWCSAGISVGDSLDTRRLKVAKFVNARVLVHDLPSALPLVGIAIFEGEPNGILVQPHDPTDNAKSWSL